MQRLPQVNLEPASAGDIDQVTETIRDLARWLKQKGIHQWGESFPREWVEAEVARGELFVLREGGRVIASLVLSSEAGELCDNSGDRAMYLQRVAVIRDRGGQRLGEALIAWAEREARQSGAKFLRLVCDSTNGFLKAYYKALGYESTGVKFYPPWKMKFERFRKAL